MSSSPNQLSLILPTWIRVVTPGGLIEEMKLETYLAGAVAAEIGVTAPLEALKAQAVASRTYVASVRRHPEQNADVCLTSHCQKWTAVDPVTAPDVFRALSETWGLVAAYEGNLINAFFFEHCDGHTRNAEEMLMPSFAYLRGVDCSCGFLAMKGHGVGMCKRGAIVMARRGASFEQILGHYYRGVLIARARVDEPAASAREISQPSHAPVPPTPAPAKKKKEPAPAGRKPADRAPAATTRSRKAKETAATISTEKLTLPAEPPLQPAEPTPIPPVVMPTPVIETKETAPTFPLSEPIEITPSVEKATAPVAVIETAPVVAEETQPAPAAIEPPAPVSVAPTSQESGEPSATTETDQSEPAPMPATRVQRLFVDYLPGERVIAGCLPRARVGITIEDTQGRKTLVFSGSAPHYGEGGFETVVAEDGAYRVWIDGQVIEVNLRGETAFIHAG